MIERLRILLVVVALVACKRHSTDDTKVTVNSTDDATKSIIDPDYRFELAWPGDGWKLLHEHDAARISPQAIAGAVQQDNVFGVVIVEAAPGVELDPLVDLLVDKMGLTDKQVAPREHVMIAGTRAARAVVTGKVGGVEFRYIEVVFLHGGFAYQVLGWGTLAKLSPDGHELQPLFDAFKLTEGKVSGRAAKPVVDARGPGWRVTHGVFESGVTGIHVRPAATWNLLVGSELEQTNGDAEVGLVHVDPEIYIIAISERAPPPDARPKFIETFRAKLGGKEIGTWTTQFAGHELELAKLLTPGPMGFEYLHGVDIHDNRLTQILAWYFPGDRERATKIIQAGFDSFGYLPSAQAAKLADELARAPDTQSAIGAGFALRRGVYKSFANSWSWTAPPGNWRINTGERARTANAMAELSFVEPNHNIYGLVFTEPTPSTPSQYHTNIVAKMSGQNRTTPESIDLGGTTATSSTIDMGFSGETLRYRVTTAVKSGHAVQLLMWGTPEDLDHNADQVLAAIHDGLHVDHLATTESIGREYLDHRMGFAVAPPAGAALSDESPPETSAIETFVSWKNGARVYASVVAVYMAGSDEQWSLDFMEQRVRDRLGASTADVKHTEVPFAGGIARKLALADFTVFILIRNQIVYAYLTTDGGLDAFRLLDQ